MNIAGPSITLIGPQATLLGAAAEVGPEATQAAQMFVQRFGRSPSRTEFNSYIGTFPADKRNEVTRALILAGVTPVGISRSTVWGILALLSAGASAYHGTRRNDSIGWGVWWFIMGTLFPVASVAVALAQGYGKPKGR